MPIQRKEEGDVPCDDPPQATSFKNAIHSVRAGLLLTNGHLVNQWLRDPAARHVSVCLGRILEKDTCRGPILRPPSAMMPLLP
jgi:hypothetical protein